MTPVTMSPLNASLPLLSLMSTLCGVPASPFRNSIWNGTLAGALTSGVVNVRLRASTTTGAPPAAPLAPGDPPASAEATADATAEAAGADAAGAPDAPGDPEGPG